MNRKKFLSGLVALGAAPAAMGSLAGCASSSEEAPAGEASRGSGYQTHYGEDLKYTADEITQAGSDFFGITTEAMAKGVQHVFGDLGQPDAYIKGDEGSAAFVVGFRYGAGYLIRKNRDPRQVYWRGPSVGFDAGGNASKCFTLVYDLRDDARMFQRFPGVAGSIYFIAGLGHQAAASPYAHRHRLAGGVTLAPMRTGVGLRAGVNVQYQAYSERRDWFPL